MDDFVSLKDFPDYEINTKGEIRSWRRRYGSARPIKPRLVKGYHQVALSNSNGRGEKYVHVLVLETFVGSRPDGMEARHLNGNSTDNRLENLQWGTPKQNGEDKVKHGTTRKGELPAELIATLREEYGPPRGRGVQAHGRATIATLAAKHNLNPNTVAAIVRGKTYV